MKIKHYIKFGEECPICYEPIHSKTSAYLNNCGHSFHRECIHKWALASITSNDDRSCPKCRENIGFYEFERYS